MPPAIRPSTVLPRPAPAVCIMTSIYIAVACSGYAAFGDEVAGSIMTAFTTPMWLVTAGNLMVVIHLGPAYQICLPYPAFPRGQDGAVEAQPGLEQGALVPSPCPLAVVPGCPCRDGGPEVPPAQPPAPPSHPFPALPQGLLMRLWFRSMFVVLITFLACLMPWCVLCGASLLPGDSKLRRCVAVADWMHSLCTHRSPYFPAL